MADQHKIDQVIVNLVNNAVPSGKVVQLDLNSEYLSVDVLSSGLCKGLTTFPAALTSTEYNSLQRSTAKLAESLAANALEHIQAQLSMQGSLAEEKDYWKRTFNEWKSRFGDYKNSEAVGTLQEKDDLVVYVLFHFDKGTVLTQFRKNPNGMFYIGTYTRVVPRLYRLIPQDKSHFLVYNYTLKTVTPVKFSFDRQGNKVTGLTIQNGSGKLTAARLY